MRFNKQSAWAVLALAILISPLDAAANGRFPRAQRLIETPSDSNQLALVATYGILVTKDRGQVWNFICESSFASQNLEGTDVTLEQLSSGDFLAGIFSSVRHSRAGHCEWQRVLGETNGESVPDLLVSKSGSGVALGVVVKSDGGNNTIRIRESTDNGDTWKDVGVPLPSADIVYPFTVDEAPSDPARLYVTGINQNNQGVLVRSADRGKNWETLQIAGTSQDDAPYIAAVHPTNADVLFVRTNGTIDDGQTANDGLLYSADGGKSWSELIRAHAKLFGFALSPDANTVLIGYGDPEDPITQVDPESLGIYTANAQQLQPGAFEKIYAGKINCLTWTKSGLYACTSQDDSGFALGFRKDAAFTLSNTAPFTSLMKQPEIVGPLPCPACSSGSLCAADWADTCRRLNACPDGAPSAGAAGSPVDCAGGAAGVTNGSGNSGDTSNGGASTQPGNGGSSAASGGSGSRSDQPKSTKSADEPRFGCGCRTPRSRTAGALGALFSALVLAGARRVRRQNSR